jgi:hypothetical protein
MLGSHMATNLLLCANRNEAEDPMGFHIRLGSGPSANNS